MSGTTRHGGRGPRPGAVLLAAVAWALGPACASVPQGDGGARSEVREGDGAGHDDGVRQGEGRVIVARGHPVMLEEGGDRTFVAPAPAASFTGVGALRELRPGDRVRYRWRAEAGGVRLAHEIDVAPVRAAEPEFTYNESELEVASSQGRAPALLDVRPASEHQAGHLPTARSLPRSASDGDVARALPADRSTLVVVYGEGPRDAAPDEMTRRLLAAGAKNVRVLRAGMQGWMEADRPVEVSAEHARSLPLERWIVVDVRAREHAAAARPAGAVSLPLDSFPWDEFGPRRPLPPILLVGSGEQDPTPARIVEQLRRGRASKASRNFVQLGILAGGFDAWMRAGLPVERGGTLATVLPFVPFAPGEISPAEFEQLWARRGGGQATVLDVRNGSASEPWVVRIPLEELTARIGELPREREVVVFCSMGVRAQVAAELLRQRGYRARFLRATTSH